MTIPKEVLRKALTDAIGEPAVLAADVSWDLRNPCADCPFVKTSPFHQGVAKAVTAVVETIDNHTFSHTCHKTDYRPNCDGPVAGKETGRPVQHCAGATLMLLKTGNGKDLQLPLLQAMEAGKLSDQAVRDMTARAHADDRIFRLPEFIDFYYRNLLKMLPPAKRRKFLKSK